MEFTIYKYFKKHPAQFKIAKLWVKLHLPLPERIKRQIANEIHAEMIIRLMDFTVKNKNLTIDDALRIHFNLGLEFAQQTKEFLSINPDNARDLSKIIDFLHDLLLIKGKKPLKLLKMKPFRIGQDVRFIGSQRIMITDFIIVICNKKCIKVSYLV